MNATRLSRFVILLVFAGLTAMFAASFAYRLSNPSLVRRVTERERASPSFGEQGMASGLTEELMGRIAALMGKLREEPENFQIRLELAEHFMEAKDWVSASLHLHKALKLKPEDQAVLYNLGVLQYEQGLFAESAGSFERLLSKFQDPGASFNLAVLYHQQLGREGEAKAIFAEIAASEQAEPELRARAKNILETLK
jgi:tetratricopeptide (TPR) repeat protein